MLTKTFANLSWYCVDNIHCLLFASNLIKLIKFIIIY